MNVRAAALDCGTNSTRLLVVAEDGTALAREMQVTRLGQGVDATGRLHPDGIARTLDVLRDYRRICDVHQIERVGCVATSAARDALNAAGFLKAVEDVVGVAPVVLTGAEEARLSFRGATGELDPGGGPYVVVDIGGGSTEVALGPLGPLGPLGAGDELGNGAAQGVEGIGIAGTSLDVGCVRLTERYLHHDPPAQGEVGALVDWLRPVLGRVAARLLPFAEARPRTLIGLAGTVSTLVQLHYQVARYTREAVHHRVLGIASVRRLVRTLAVEPAAARRARTGMDPGRADVIVAGALVLQVVMEEMGFAECLASESDILDGIVASMRESPGRAG